MRDIDNCSLYVPNINKTYYNWLMYSADNY